MKKIIFTYKCLFVFLLWSPFKVWSQQTWAITGSAIGHQTSLLGTLNHFDLNVITNNRARISINTRGQIAIGSTEFTNALSINGGLSLDCKGSNNGSFTNSIRFGSALRSAGILSPQFGAVENLNGLNFYTNNTVRFAIGAEGNVGIGTTHPLAKLDVQDGDIKTSGNFTASGFNVHDAVTAASFHAVNSIQTDNEFNVANGKITNSTNANMLPIAYAKIDRNGNIISSSGNVTTQSLKPSVTLVGIQGMSIDDSFIAIATVCSTINALSSVIIANPDGNGKLQVSTLYIPPVGPVSAPVGRITYIPNPEDFTIVFFHP